MTNASGWHVDITAVHKDGSEKECCISGNQVLWSRDCNGKRPWKFHIKECDREYIDDERMKRLQMTCAGDSIYNENERVVFA